MLSSLLDRLYALTQNKHKSVWTLGFLIGLATGLGALAFSKMHKAFVYAYVRRKVLRVSPKHAAKACPYQDEFQPIELVRGGSIVSGVEGLIGNTPLVRIQSLSDLTGCDILGKAEFLNPGGSPKDRVALQIIKEAEDSNELVPNVGSWIFEGTVGSTGISLATLACAKGYNCCIIVPDDVAEEKATLLRRLGAKVECFVNEARFRAQQWMPSDNEPYARAYFADQFETNANFYAHYDHTGPEIWSQTHGRIDAFVAGTGTGGTLSGVSAYLKEMCAAHDDQSMLASSILTVAADPPGSGVYNRIKYGVMYSETEAEGTRRRHQVDSVVEGIGLNRLTRNLEMGLPFIDTAERVSDDEAVRMSRWLAKHDGLFLGSSSAVHCVAAVRTALRLKQTMAQSHPGVRPVIVTILYVCSWSTREPF
ncbi:hypothetical protein MGL_0374 [Malassezia globosa CBS 7966]|uniref:cysteine synthase n=1 Tax=Malassezia globosa (strain ATCC MYA-4612 / CBS 7966) TaxID=425265 RepID=A8PT64_MALGO|nr:uncharacterized protein MGL_0374 [Malassezia globosa CBS 7966]EDP45385.1 hypothetical protein MGL_0374 [Malassezia globosa CBS 7966]